MSGIWATRSPYQRIFAGWSPVKQVATRTPPPISPFVRNAEETLCETDDFLDQLEPIRECSTPVDETDFFDRCNEAYAAAVQTFRRKNIYCKRKQDIFGTVVGAINLSGELSFDNTTPILDMTGSLTFPMMLRKLGHAHPIVVHSRSHKLTSKELEMLEKELQSASINTAPLSTLSVDYINQFARIFVDAHFTPLEDMEALLSAFTYANSTGSIFVNILLKAAQSLSTRFSGLSFEKCTVKGTKDSTRFSAHSHTFLVRITHAHGLKPLPFGREDGKRSRYVPGSVSAPELHTREEVALAPRESSPLTCDFTFEDMANALLEAVTAPLPNGVVNLIAPIPSSVSSPLPMAFVPSEVFFPHVETPQPVHVELPEAVVESIDEVEPVCASPALIETIQDDEPVYASPVLIETIEDDEPASAVIEIIDEPTPIDYAPIEERLNSKNTKKTMNMIRTRIPDIGSPEFGGTCPSINDTSVATLAKLICEWTRDHPDAKGFLDLRSRGGMAASLYTVMPRDQLEIGHLVYSQDYRDALLGLYMGLRRPAGSSAVCSTRCPYEEVRAPLSGLESKYFSGYQMVFMIAVYMDRNNIDLFNTLNAFRLSTSTQVMWACLTKPQYECVSRNYTLLKYREVCPNFIARKYGSALYEITK